MNFHLPVIGKLYFVPEENIFIIFRNIIFSRSQKNISFDTFTDENRKEKIYYQYILEPKFKENNLSNFTFIPVDNKLEMKRRPFDYTDLQGAIELLSTKKKYSKVLIYIETIDQVEFSEERYNYTEHKVEDIISKSNQFNGTVKKGINNTIIIHSYRAKVVIDINNIKLLRFRFYEFKT